MTDNKINTKLNIIIKKHKLNKPQQQHHQQQQQQSPQYQPIQQTEKNESETLNTNNINVIQKMDSVDVKESYDSYTAHRRRIIGFQDSKILQNIIHKRKKQQILHNNVNSTPKNLGNIDLRTVVDLHSDLSLLREVNKQKKSLQFRKISSIIEQPKQNSYGLSNVSVNMEDITIGDDKINVGDGGGGGAGDGDNENNIVGDKEKLQNQQDLTEENQIKKLKKTLPSFIKIFLRETDDIVLYEKINLTVLRDSDEAKCILADNQYYENLNKNRRTSDAETQTNAILYKSRTINTERIKTYQIGTFVSNYDMFDTYADLEAITKLTDSYDNKSQINITTINKKCGENIIDKLITTDGGGGDSNFKLASMVIERLLASNIYHEKQKRFRNMILPNPLDANVKYLYRLDILWKYKIFETIGKSVVSFSWCPGHTDILAIGYGIYNFVPHNDKLQSGYVCVWSIKNPVNPERSYKYSVPVTVLSFSKKTPQLLAIGLYNGTIEIRDITDINGVPIAKSNHLISSLIGYEPVWHIEWIHSGPSSSSTASAAATTTTTLATTPTNEKLLIISQNGLIMKCAITNGPYLLGFRQMKLDRVVGEIEGLQNIVNKKLLTELTSLSSSSPPQSPLLLEAERHCEALTLQIHPTKSDIYFVGTDEGCLHRCSTFYPNQHTDVMRVHNGSVFSMEFSPWSPKIYLTCGNDWFIRIWIENISEPIVELTNGMEAIHCAAWSPIHSTIICCATRHHIELWDIRRNCLKPLSKTIFNSGNVPLTICCFTQCGRSIIVGDAEGTTYVCALEDMPFPPHYQYDELQSAIYRNLIAKPELLRQVKSFGYLGY